MPPPSSGAARRRSIAAWTVGAAVALALAALVGCGVDDPTASADRSTTATPRATGPRGTTGSTTPAPPESGAGDDVCLDADVVGQVLGTDVDRISYFGGNATASVSYSATGCAYDPADGRDEPTASIAALAAEQGVEPGRLFEAVRREAARDGAQNRFEELDGPGDGAAVTADELIVHTPAATLFVSQDDPGSLDPDPGFQDRAVAVATAIVALGLDGAAGTERLCRADVAAAVARAYDVTGDGVPGGSGRTYNQLSFSITRCGFPVAGGSDRRVSVGVAPAGVFRRLVAEQRDSTFSERFVPTSVAGRSAFHTNHGLVVDAVGRPVEVEVTGDRWSRAQRDQLEEDLAGRVLTR